MSKMDVRKQLEDQGLCASSTPEFGEVVYCTKPRREHASIGEDHTDGVRVWKCAFSTFSPSYLARLAREPQTRVRDWKGDPKRDPALVDDVSKFFVAAPSFRK